MTRFQPISINCSNNQENKHTLNGRFIGYKKNCPFVHEVNKNNNVIMLYQLGRDVITFSEGLLYFITAQ